MISANHNYITEDDIKEVLKINPKEDDIKSSFVTDGYSLYYVDGYTYPQEIRALSEDEQYQNLSKIAKILYDQRKISNVSEKEAISYMLKQNKEVDYENMPDNDFNSKEEVDMWWQDKDDKMIYKIYDEYYGIGELIASW